ncbi:ribosome biogenesis GTPase [Balneicella halophila]|uniref:Small ribosomal subunit biogenesis GTPase RsgA n=1 Tax=Balneicella halophila TaxID=1537566 RepID=A0A7L4URS5_BALHA|nr:ribosome small subunit-dependent GTPase A [Balneicella halophila]PVX52202.1 ribosome biogenesis GTPase [Balneicella halophila]
MELNKGLVLKSTGSFYQVVLENNRKITATLKGKLRTKGIRTTNPVAVGDYVQVEVGENDTGVIKSVIERKNYIIRKATNLSKESHILAANIDQALLLITLTSPVTTTMFIDRFLVSAEAYRIPVILIFNKIDLHSNDEEKYLQELRTIYEKVGYPCYAISAHNEADVATVRELLKNKVSMVAGHSGVGKSTLINAVDSRFDLKTGKISTSHNSGKHTTTFAEMFELAFEGYIIDTPGIRGFGLVDIDREELAHFFKEIFKYSHGCKYNNCKHVYEPECAVREAVQDGLISESRYENYLRLFLDEDTKHRQ